MGLSDLKSNSQNGSDTGDYNKNRLSAPPDFDGPTANRKCTDIIFFILIFSMWVAMTAVGIYSWRNGDYRTVLYPMDYAGNICGTDFGPLDMSEYSKVIYINNFSGGVCVKECPTVANFVDVQTFITYNGVWQGDGAVLTAEDYISMPDYTNATGVLSCTEDDCPTDPSQSWASSGIRKGNGFAWYAVDTIEVLGNRCISNPSALDELKEQIWTSDDTPVFDLDGLNETRSVWSNLYGDLYEARYHIMLFGCVLSMVIGFFYSQLLRVQIILGVMIWGSILGSISILFACGGYAFSTATSWEEAEPQVQSDSNITAAKVCSYILLGLGGLAVVTTIFLRKQIMLSMACVRAAGRSISAMPTMVLFPFFQVIGLSCFMIIWLVYAVHLASTGDIVTKTLPSSASVTVRSFIFDDFTKRSGWYLIFCLFWTIAFVGAVGEIVIAMCIAKWYFSRDKSKVGSFTIFKSISETFRYHIGTAAFGSFIIAVTQIIRLFVTYLQKKARELNNKVGEALLCCCQCCLWLFEKVVKFLNKNAYIQTAIFGTPFCKSAREAFSLIVRNAGKVASISYVSTLVLFLGKVFVSTLTTGAAYVYMDQDLVENAKIYSAAGPCLLVFVLSFFIGGIFLGIFDMSTSTILQCFVADEEMFDGDECYAEGDLRKWLDDFEEEERKIVAGS